MRYIYKNIKIKCNKIPKVSQPTLWGDKFH